MSFAQWIVSRFFAAARRTARRGTRSLAARRRPRLLEHLECRSLLAADPLPVLMVIADQRDFYYQEYGDTRLSLEEAGLQVRVAATTTLPSTPHANSGQGSGSGVVTPDLTLAAADADDYSAIVFVGGWGSSMYQYAFSGTYDNAAYNGNAVAKGHVNRLINDFVDQDKHVAAICHGVTVLAWARVDGQSPIAGKSVAAYALGSPASTIGGVHYVGNQLPTRWHIETNGAYMFPARSLGNPFTAADDVWVDGRIITAENYDAAREFGRVIGQQLQTPPPANEPPTISALADAAIAEDAATGPLPFAIGDAETPADQLLVSASSSNPQLVPEGNLILAGSGANRTLNVIPAADQHGAATIEIRVTDAAGAVATESFVLTVAPVNDAPSMPDQAFSLAENSPAGAVAGTIAATDVDPGQQMTFSILGGNLGGAFAIEPATGRLLVANPAALDFETQPVFQLLVEARDNGPGSLSDQATVTVQLTDVNESLPPVEVAGGNLVVRGTPGPDRIQVASDSRGQWVLRNGQWLGPFALASDARILVWGGDGDDQIMIASSITRAAELRGEAGRDTLLGGSGDDLLLGGEGDDQLNGGRGNDRAEGEAGNDYISGAEGNDLLLGGDGNDIMCGNLGDDLVLGGAGDDAIYGKEGRDLLLGGTGRDRLDGGSEEDLLLGGSLSPAVDEALLVAMHRHWAGAADLAAARAQLAAGILGGPGLATAHVEDGERDELLGGAAADWLFALLGDATPGRAAEDVLA